METRKNMKACRPQSVKEVIYRAAKHAVSLYFFPLVRVVRVLTPNRKGERPAETESDRKGILSVLPALAFIFIFVFALILLYTNAYLANMPGENRTANRLGPINLWERTGDQATESHQDYMQRLKIQEFLVETGYLSEWTRLKREIDNGKSGWESALPFLRKATQEFQDRNPDQGVDQNELFEAYALESRGRCPAAARKHAGILKLWDGDDSDLGRNEPPSICE